MKDFQLRNDTKLQLCMNPVEKLRKLTGGKRVLFVYGGGSVKKNGCLEDVKKAVSGNGGTLFELENASRERTDIERGIRMAKERRVEMVIGAGGANVMDCAKLIAFGVCHEEEWWEFVKGKKNPYGLTKLSLVPPIPPAAPNMDWAPLRPMPGPVILERPTASRLTRRSLFHGIRYPWAER